MYTDFILKNMPRVLTQIDRDKHSKTYGSCDRSHWHLKIRDFTSAILQQSGLALAIVYDLNFEGNIYYKNKNIRDWAEATVEYWAAIQLSDGSFNEYYPWEHGFPPTAFSLYSACEIYKRLGMDSSNLKDKFRKTAKYLSTHIEEKAFNQEIASITALYNAYTVLNEQWILEGLNRKLDRVLTLQSEEGWFPEYGGADIGYLSVAFDMLAEYYWISKDERVKKPLEKTLNFIKYFIHPDSTAGGEYGSRNTTYFLPNGLEVLSCNGNKIAEGAIQILFGNADKNNFFLDSTDDRYFSHYLLHSFTRALEKRMQTKACTEAEALPFEFVHEKVFSEAGLISFSNGVYSAFISMKKGGVIKIFNEGKEVFIDCGYRIEYGKGCAAATNWIDDSYKVLYSENEYSVEGNMNKISLKVSTPILHVGLRAIALVFGNKIISFLKKKIIFVDKHNDVQFKRDIKLTNNNIIITDNFYSSNEVNILSASNMSLRHVASGKFFMTSDLISNSRRKYNGIGTLKLLTNVHVDKCSTEVSYDRLE